MLVGFLLAEFSVDGKNFRVTDESECQDGDCVCSLQMKSQFKFPCQSSWKAMKKMPRLVCFVTGSACTELQATHVLHVLRELFPMHMHRHMHILLCTWEYWSHLLIDGEELGCAGAFWNGSVHRGVAKSFKRAGNVEFLVDDLM